MISISHSQTKQRSAWTSSVIFVALTVLALRAPAVTSDPASAFVSNITDFGASNRVDPLSYVLEQSYAFLKTTKRSTSARATVSISRTNDAGGSSLGVCYHSGDSQWSGCAQVQNGHSGCLAAGKSATVTKRLPKGYVNRNIEIHANRNRICIDWIGISYGGGDMYPKSSKLAVTGDMTFECGHPWAYSGQETNGFQHKCLIIGNDESTGYTNTYSFSVDTLWQSTSAIVQSRSENNLASVPNSVRLSCGGISSWSRKDLPQTSSDCDKYDKDFDDGANGPRKKIAISEEEHRTNLLVNPNYAGNPVVNGTVEIETNYK